MPIDNSHHRRPPAARRGFLLAFAIAGASGLAWTHIPVEPAIQAAPALAGQLSPDRADSPAPTHFWEDIKVRSGDTLARILTSRGHKPALVHDVVASGEAGQALGSLKAGSTIKLRTDMAGELSEISYEPDAYRVVSIQRSEEGSFHGELIEKPTITTSRFAEGKISSSLFAAGKQAGVSNGVIIEMADAFSYDIDFALEVQAGDSFRVLYEEILVDGEKVRDGKLLAAEFINKGKTYRAIRFVGANGRAGYYKIGRAHV